MFTRLQCFGRLALSQLGARCLRGPNILRLSYSVGCGSQHMRGLTTSSALTASIEWEKAGSLRKASVVPCSRRGVASEAISPANQVKEMSTKKEVIFRSLTDDPEWGESRFRLVPFVKEDLRDVMREVPDIHYYYVGDANPGPYPFKDTPLSEPIPLDNEAPPQLIPPNRELQYSRLENGLRIISMDRGGCVANLGLFVHAGSRWETEKTFGCSQYLEHAAFQATAHLSWLRTIKTIETLGMSAGCSAGREHIIYHAELDRRYVPIMLPLLTGNVIFPRFLSWDIERKKKEFAEEREKFANNIEAQVTELLHITAWPNNTLGNRLNAHPRYDCHYEPDTLRSFMLQNFSPDRMVLVGLNVVHDELTKWTMRAFVDYEAIPPAFRETPKPRYEGGEARVDHPTAKPSCHLAIAFETPGGWKSEDLVPLTVLQTILGGGGSFSTGGPGKGMYTRLYLEVLSAHWVESCVAFNTQYSDSGLFGLYMTADARMAPTMVNVLLNQFKRMGTVTEEELSRAKNSLKTSIWMNLENRGVLMEDLGRQMLMSGKIFSGTDLCNLVDAVTPADIFRAASRILKTVPTVVSFGDVAHVPRHHRIVEALKGP